MTLDKILEEINKANSIVILTHENPDGDAIGSLLAAGILLKEKGKQVVMVCQDPVPENLKVLPDWQEVLSVPAFHEAHHISSFDLGVSLDASDMARLGEAGPLFAACPVTLLIDHHPSNTRFAQYNYIDDQVAATGNLVFRMFETYGVPISQDAATCLYAALSSDTGNFSFGLMDQEFFLQMAELMKAGLEISAISRHLHLTKDMSYYRLLAAALDSLRFDCDGKISSMQLTNKDFETTGARREQAEGLVNQGLYISGVKMSFLATQDPEGVKFSLRCLPPYNVSKIAVAFGGGGHVLAAGCTVQMPFDMAVEAMRKSMMQAVCN